MTKTLTNKFISVKEFAKLAGVSPQSIYKQVGKKLSIYSTKVDNRVKIDISALWEVYGIESYQPIQPEVSTDSTNDSTEVEQAPDIIQEYIQTLKKEIEEKNEQIKKFQEETSELRKLLDQEQQLRLVESQRNIELQEPKRRRWFIFKK